MLQSASYNEYKFLVSNEKLSYVRNVLGTFHGLTDPFPEGIVDSIYYDSLRRHAYRQCLDGEPAKRKFRIRGYGDGSFHQLHMKDKDVFAVGKLKSRIEPAMCERAGAPDWLALRPRIPGDPDFELIQAFASFWGGLIPVIRIRYYRYRYRINDYRLTLDTNIEVMGFSNGWDYSMDHFVIPYHVLEVKTFDRRPYLPFFGLAQLPQISFSKFFLGINLLERRELA